MILTFTTTHRQDIVRLFLNLPLGVRPQENKLYGKVTKLKLTENINKVSWPSPKAHQTYEPTPHLIQLSFESFT